MMNKKNLYILILVVQNDLHHPIQISLENIEHSLRDLTQQIKEYVKREPFDLSTDTEGTDEIEDSTNDDNPPS